MTSLSLLYPIIFKFFFFYFLFSIYVSNILNNLRGKNNFLDNCYLNNICCAGQDWFFGPFSTIQFENAFASVLRIPHIQYYKINLTKLNKCKIHCCIYTFFHLKNYWCNFKLKVWLGKVFSKAMNSRFKRLTFSGKVYLK